MSLWDWLLSREDEEQEQSTSGTLTQESVSEKADISATDTTTQSEGAQAGQSYRNVNLLGTPNLEIMNSLISGLGADQAAGGSSEGVQTQADNLAAIARTAKESVAGFDIDSIVESAKGSAELKYMEKQGAQTNRNIAAIGSRDNSAAQELAQRGDRDLATLLAGVEADARLAGADVSSKLTVAGAEAGEKAILGAQTADEQTSNILMEALALAKGVEAGESMESLETQDLFEGKTENALSHALIKEMVDQQSTGTSAGTSSGGSSILDWLEVISKFQGNRGAKAN